MAFPSLSSIVTAIVSGLAGVTGLSSATVTDNNWQVIENPVSAFVYPAGRGRQALEAVTCFTRLHSVLVELHLKNTGNIQTLYDNTQTYIDRVLDWFQSNDTLTTGVLSCHADNGIVYDVAEVRNENGGILERVITFTVPVLI